MKNYLEPKTKPTNNSQSNILKHQTILHIPYLSTYFQTIMKMAILGANTKESAHRSISILGSKTVILLPLSNLCLLSIACLKGSISPLHSCPVISQSTVPNCASARPKPHLYKLLRSCGSHFMMPKSPRKIVLSCKTGA